MKKTINSTHIEGYLYQTNKLEKKVTGPNSKHPGTEFIRGEIQIATDDALTNIVSVFFTYVTALTSKNKTNPTYDFLDKILSGQYGTVMGNGQDKAVKVRIDSALGLNEWYDNSTGELISVMRNEGGFIHLISGDLAADENTRNTFDCDMLITAVKEIEADDEKQIPAHAKIMGYAFDFRKALLPVSFVATSQGAINYFLGLGASQKTPVFTRVKGNQVSTVINKTITEESAFGEASVRTVSSTRKNFVVNWSAKDTYAWDDESSMTAKELADAVAERNVFLATRKQEAEDYKKNQSNANNAISAAPVAAAPQAGSFNF